MIKDLCPGCGRHCYLNEAQCERGIEYANTGIMPPRRPKQNSDHLRRHSEQKQKYLAMSKDEKTAWNLREMGAEVEKTESLEGLFDCLREDDRVALLMLLEKVKQDWKMRAKKRMEE